MWRHHTHKHTHTQLSCDTIWYDVPGQVLYHTVGCVMHVKYDTQAYGYEYHSYELRLVRVYVNLMTHGLHEGCNNGGSALLYVHVPRDDRCWSAGWPCPVAPGYLKTKHLKHSFGQGRTREQTAAVVVLYTLKLHYTSYVRVRTLCYRIQMCPIM